jgi:hypothetical protein
LFASCKIGRRLLVALAVLGFGFLWSCSKATSPIERKLAAYWNKHCKSSSPCEIRLEDLANWKWDRIYIFPAHTGRNEVLAALNESSYKFEEFSRKIVFTRNGRLVHSEQSLSSMEGLTDGEVVFGSLESTATYQVYSRKDAVFHLNRIALESGRGHWFQLSKAHNR